MCAINPKRKAHFAIRVYTAHDITDEEWEQLVLLKLLEAEQMLNADARLRWHIEGEITS